MKITKIDLQKVKKENSRLRGIASILIDDAFVIHDIRIINGDKGLFLAMPNRKTATGEYKDVCHPVNSETRKLFAEAILAEYNKETK